MKLAFSIDQALRLASLVRVVSGSACEFWLNAVKAQLAQIEFINEGVNDSYRVVCINEIVKALWQQNTL